MPKRSKHARHCIAAIQKHWDDTKGRRNEQKSYSESYYDEQDFDILWTDSESEPLNDNQFIEELERLRPDAFEQLIKKAEQSNTWVIKGRKPSYTGSAPSTLRNKRAAWKKAASNTNKITNWFPTATKRSISSDTDESLDEIDELLYDEVVNSGNDDSEFTLNSLDTILKEKPDDV